MKLLDSLIEALSPTWGAQRKAARLAIKLAAYPESQATRVSREISGRGASADWNLELGFDRRNLVDRARVLERDNPLATALLDRSVEAVIGEEGFQLHAQGTKDVWNKNAEEMWENWCQNEADSRGILTFTEILETVYRSKLRDGDVGVILQANGSLRIVESDEISSPKGGYTIPTDADGVEMDSDGKPIYYYIQKPDPKVIWSDRRHVAERIKIPAENFIFLANRTRAGQTRGITTFNGIFDILEQIDGTMEAVTIAAHMAACFGLIVKKNGPLWGLTASTDSAGNARSKFRMEPGSVVRLEPGEDIEQIKPQAASMMEPHVRLLMRLAGTRFGIPLEVFLCDYSSSNFSNTRAALLQTFRKWSREQAGIARFASRIRNWKTLEWIRTGKLPYNPDAEKHTWTKPGWKWIDPMAEIQGALAEIDAGISTRTEVCARSGKNFEDIVQKLAEEQALLEDNNIAPVRSKLTREPALSAEEQVSVAEAGKPDMPAEKKVPSGEEAKAFWEEFWKAARNPPVS